MCSISFHLMSNITLKHRCHNQYRTTDQSCTNYIIENLIYKLHFQSKGRDKNGNFLLGWLIRVKAVVFNLLSWEVKCYIKSSMSHPRYNYWPIFHCIKENLVFKLHFQSKGRDKNWNFLLGWLISEKNSCVWFVFIWGQILH